MAKFYYGQTVRFKSQANYKFWFRGRIIRQLGPDHYLVEDNTDLKPRVVTADRIEACNDVGFERPRGDGT